MKNEGDWWVKKVWSERHLNPVSFVRQDRFIKNKRHIRMMISFLETVMDSLTQFWWFFNCDALGVLWSKSGKKEAVKERISKWTNSKHNSWPNFTSLFILSFFSIFFNNFPLNFDVYYNWQKVVYLGRVKERKKNHIVFSFMFELEIHALDFNCYFPFMYSSSYNLPMIPNVCIMHSVSFIIFVSLPRFLIFMRCRNIYIYSDLGAEKCLCPIYAI